MFVHWRFDLVCCCIALILFGHLFWTSARANPLDAVVSVRATIPGDARTAAALGRERTGTGVVIDGDGLVLTIGYLILEADSVQVQAKNQKAQAADIIAYDSETGFGLLRTVAPLGVQAMEFGRSADAVVDAKALIVGAHNSGGIGEVRVVSRRTFAGYWEYLLPDAIFTAPPQQYFSGAALMSAEGRLLGIGSLIVGDATGSGDARHGSTPGNMFVPIDALKPIFGELLAEGRTSKPRRPWLGMFTSETRGRVFVDRITPGGPAAAAGIAVDDVVVAVDGQPIRNMADFFTKVWDLGDAGDRIPLTTLGSEGLANRTVISGNRYDYLKLNRSY